MSTIPSHGRTSLIHEEDPPLIHFLRCPECSFISINLNRFKQHMPCCLRQQPTKYFTYVCSTCQAMSTSRDVMEEHREIYHRCSNGLIVESFDTIKGCSLASFVATGACLDKSAVSVLTCSLCSFSCTSTKDLVDHVQHLHSQPQMASHTSPTDQSHQPHSSPLQAWLEMLRKSSELHAAAENGTMSSRALSPQTQTSNSCTEKQLKDHLHYLNSISDVLDSETSVQQQNLMTSMIKSAVLLEAVTKGIFVPTSTGDMVHDQPQNHESFNSSSNSNCLSNGTTTNSSSTSDKKQSKPLLQVKLEVDTNDCSLLNPQSSDASWTAAAASNMTVKSGTNDDGKPVHNTMRKTNSDMKVIRRFLQQQCSEFREPHLISANDLDNHLQKFVAKARKKDGHEYEPESLKAFVHSMERHLKIFGYNSSILADDVFSGTRNVLQARMQTLRELSRSSLSASQTVGLHGNSAVGSKKNLLSVENTKRLIQSGLLGPNSPQSLINTLWYINRVHFGIRGSHKHRSLTWGQFRVISTLDEATVNRTEGTFHEYLQFSPNSSTDERQFYIPSKSNSDQGFHMDALDVFRVYNNMRPVEVRNSNDPFYLVCDPDFEQGGPWFKPYGASLNILGNIPKRLGVRPSTLPNNNAATDTHLSTPLYSKMASISHYKDDVMSESSMEVSTVSPKMFPGSENIYLDHVQLSMIEDASNEMAVDMTLH